MHKINDGINIIKQSIEIVIYSFCILNKKRLKCVSKASKKIGRYNLFLLVFLIKIYKNILTIECIFNYNKDNN